MSDFDFDACHTVSGTLWTAHPDRLIAALQAAYPADDPEREFRATRPTRGEPAPAPCLQPVTLFLRHDALPSPTALARQILAACPDALGEFMVEAPYALVQERDFGCSVRLTPDAVQLAPWVRMPDWAQARTLPRPPDLAGR